MKLKTREITLVAVMAAVICIAGPLTVPLGPIPLTLANFAVYLTAAVLGAKLGPMAVAVYLLLGMAGAPVCSGFSGGAQKLLGPTGGYLMGDLPCAFITGLGVGTGETAPVKKWRLPACMLLGAAVLYILGTAWFMLQSGNGLAASLGMCVVPFLPAEVVKIAAACLLAWPIRRAVYRK